MPVENNQKIFSSNPIGNASDTAQQDWMELGQQDATGETLKAKKWATERRLVDDASHHGNIHTGTEQQENLDKTDSVANGSSDYQSVNNENQEVQENGESDPQPYVSEHVSPDVPIRNNEESTQATSVANEIRTDAESVVSNGGSDTLIPEQHFDASAQANTPKTISTTDPAEHTATVHAIPPTASNSPVNSDETPESVIRDQDNVDSTPVQVEGAGGAQYIASNDPDVSEEERIDSSPDTVQPEGPTITTIAADNTISSFITDNHGDQVNGAGQEITVTGIYAPDSGVNLLENTAELLTINNYREVDDHGYNYMGGHDYFRDNTISTSHIRGGIITFSDGTIGIIDSASNGITRDRDGDGTIDYEESSYIYYKAYDGIEETNPTTITGEAVANSTVELFDDGVKIGETTTDDNGHWIIDTNLHDGEHNLTSQFTDENGISSALSDNTAILVGEPDLVQASDSGRSQFDNLTSNQAVTLNGSGANSGESITIYDENGQNVGGGLVDENGKWSVTTDMLTEGDHQLSATVTDIQGNESEATEPLQVTVDTSPPESPQIASVNDNGVSIYSTNNPGDRTEGASDDITVTGLFAPGSSINMLDNKPELVTDNDYREVDDHGYNYMGGHGYFDTNGISIGQLRGGIITFSDGTTGIIDSVSNGVKRDSNADGVIDDNIVDGVADYHENSYIYYKSYDDITKAQPVTIEGTAEADSSVEIFDGETLLGTVQTDAEGNWSLSTTVLPEGEHNITATATDAAGNQSSPSEIVEHTVAFNQAPIAIDDSTTTITSTLPEGGTIISTEDDSTIVQGEIVTEGDTGSSVDNWIFHHNGGPLTIDTLSESGSSFIDIDGDGEKNHIDTMMRLYDSDGNEIAMNDDSNSGNEDGSTNDYYSHNQDSFIQLDDLPPGDYSLAIGSWDLTSEEVASDHNDNYDTPYTYDHAQDTGPYQVSFQGNISFQHEIPISTNEDTPLTISADTLLANDSDADGGTLSIIAVSEEVVDSDGNVVGKAAQDDDGNIIFTPGSSLDSLSAGEDKAVSFTYTMSDGQGGTDTATATINVEGTDNDLIYISETAGYRNVVGLYQTDDDGNPVSGTVIIDDQNGMVTGTHLADLEPGNHDFFIIANGADEIDENSVITFDTSGDKPTLLINGEPAAHPVYFTEPAFNPDDKDHFHFESDGEGGTYIKIEDLPNLGDADFGDVVLHTDFEMDDILLTRTAEDGITDEDLKTVEEKENLATTVATTGFDAAETDPASQQMHIDGISDLSLNMPSLDLESNAEAAIQTTETQETPIAQHVVPAQAEIPVPESSEENTQPGSNLLPGEDLAHSLPAQSLSTLFDEPENEENTIKDLKQSRTPVSPEADTTAASSEETTHDETPVAPPVTEEQQPLEELEDESTDVNNSVKVNETEETDISTDDLHIAADSDITVDDANISETKEDNGDFDRFSTSSDTSEENETSSLDEFSAHTSTADSENISALDELDSTDNDTTDTVDDTGLNDIDAIQEDLSQEPEHVDANGVG